MLLVQPYRAIPEPQVVGRALRFRLPTLFFIILESLGSQRPIIMVEAEFLLQLPSGEFISYKNILSPFKIYSFLDRDELFLLIPKPDQIGLKDTTIFANKSGIRICTHGKWPTSLTVKIRNIIPCKENKSIIEISWDQIPNEVLSIMCSQLIKGIQYNSNNHETEI